MTEVKPPVSPEIGANTAGELSAIQQNMTSPQQISQYEDVELTETNDQLPNDNLEDISDVTGDSESIADFNKLVQKEKSKDYKILPSHQESEVVTTDLENQRRQSADEFMRNFFLKFDMKKTLEIFQRELYEKECQAKLNRNAFPRIPQAYVRNQEITDVLVQIQKGLDEARITVEKAKATYDKLKKQRDYQKLQHRRVQQEKQKLVNEIDKLKSKYDGFEENYKVYSDKYELAVKEKMLMRLEKDRLTARVGNLEKNLQQLVDNEKEEEKEKQEHTRRITGVIGKDIDKAKDEERKAGTVAQAKTGTGFKPKIDYRSLPVKDPPNPHIGESLDLPETRLQLLKTFKGHLLGVTSLAYNPKKAILATASDDTTWKLWTIPNGELLLSGEGHQDWVGGIAFHPKGGFVATASGDGTVKLWDFIKASCSATFIEHAQSVWSCDFHYTGDFLLSASMDHTIKLWDTNVKKSKFTYRGHVDSVNSVHFQPYSSFFCSASGDKTISLWDVRSNLCIQTFYGHTNALNSVQFNNKGDLIVSADSDGLIRVWDVRMVKEMLQFDSGQYAANSAKFDQSGQVISVASEQGSIKNYNLVSKELESTLSGHEDVVHDIIWDPSNQYLISCSNDQTFRIWQ